MGPGKPKPRSETLAEADQSNGEWYNRNEQYLSDVASDQLPWYGGIKNSVQNTWDDVFDLGRLERQAGLKDREDMRNQILEEEVARAKSLGRSYGPSSPWTNFKQGIKPK